MSTQPSSPIRRTDRPGGGEDLTGELQTLRKPLAGDIPLSQVTNALVREGELYETLPNGKVHCYACAHDCTISSGGRGVCQVRYNVGGKLYVPWGYVAALQCDPTEKKPFFHVYPGSDTVTFGMLGCDMHCPYCFTGDTSVVTERGPMKFGQVFQNAAQVERRSDGDIAYPDNLRTIAGSGTWRSVRKVFKHPYKGLLVVIRPYYLPELRCTSDHRIYATDDPAREPVQVYAQELTRQHYLAVPRSYSFSSPQTVDVEQVLAERHVSYRVPWELSLADRRAIADRTAEGQTSRQIGAALGISASYVRHVRSKIARGKAGDVRTSGPLIEHETLRFPKEHRPGIPLAIPLDTAMARLLGYYCAEGSVVRDKNRPNSFTLYFTLSHNEVKIAEEIVKLLKQCLGVNARLTRRETTLAVQTSKTSAALLFKLLIGGKASDKHVPYILFDAERSVVEAFVDAFVTGDGHRYGNGKVTFTTVSPDLAYGLAWLVLKLGFLPSIYDTSVEAEGIIMGRRVKRAPHQYAVVWYEDSSVQRKVIETDDFYLVPVRDVNFVEYEGDVYNMEVEVEHNYLAGFFLVSNCQNWDISQALRDAYAGHPPYQVTPQQIVEVAQRAGAKCVASSYNEPLITSEWAVEVFKAAKAAGLTCLYISNGNATREVLEYIRPYVSGYKVDLKSMRAKNYRTLGAVLDHILDGIRLIHAMGFWLEIVTLVVPGFNDSDEELRDAVQFIQSVSPDIPWHVTAFHKDYKMRDPDNTDAKTLLRAADIGRAAGLRYVYAGNLPGRVGNYEHTYCPACEALLVKRMGYIVMSNCITGEGKCPECGTNIPGIWA